MRLSPPVYASLATLLLAAVGPGCLEGGVRIAGAQDTPSGMTVPPDTRAGLADSAAADTVVAADTAVAADTVARDTRPLPADTTPVDTQPPACEAGARHCNGPYVEVCLDGVWATEQCPGGRPCVGGYCVCTPSCDERVCGPDGCGGTCGQCPATAWCSVQGVCVAPQQSWRAVYIEGRWDGPCDSTGAPGPDIHSVQLVTPSGESRWLSQVLGQPGTAPCMNEHADPADARGDHPVGPTAGDFVSLQRGWIIGRFGQGAQIEPNALLSIFEIDGAHAGADPEPYAVYLATGMSCGSQPDRYTTCLEPLNLSVTGSVSIPVSGF